MTHLVNGGDFGAVPEWYADMQGAKYAGVPWPDFAVWPQIAKNLVFAAIRADNQAQKEAMEKKS